MKFIFIFAVVLIQILLRYIFKIVKIVRTVTIYTFVNTEEFTFFFGNQRITTMRTGKAKRCCNNFSGREGLSTDFALVLTIATIVVIDVMMGSPT